MRIALFTDGIYPFVLGGMQKHSWSLAAHLADRGVQVDIYYPAHPAITLPLSCFTEEQNKLIRPYAIPYGKYRYFPGHYIYESYKYSENIYKTFNENCNVDFIYAQGFTGWETMRQKRKGKSLPPIGVNFHGLNMFQQHWGLKGMMNNLLFRPWVKKNMKSSDIAFSLGGKLTELLLKEGIDSEKIIELPVGVERAWLREDEPHCISSPRKFVFVGRYDAVKGFDIIHGAIDKVGSGMFEFHFIGPVPYAVQLKKENIIYHGPISDQAILIDILRTTDVLVVASYSEGMPTVIIEAMASGNAIISTDVGAVRVLVDADNGVLIQPGSIGELYEAMTRMIQMPCEELLKMKRASVEKAKAQFLWDKVINNTIRELERVIGFS